jgi:Zinc finger protein
MWVLDFNLCSCWDEETGWENPEALIEHLVLAFFENDPYYPLPLAEQEFEQRLWVAFRETYLKKAAQVLGTKDERLHGLPHKFLEACEERERHRLAHGRGHGSRDHKQ